MGIPETTALQFLIMGILMDSELTGQGIRDVLAKQGVQRSGPAFYQLMARLEDSNFVKGWYTQVVIDGQIIKERRYKLTGPGVKAWQRTRDFYLNIAAGVQHGGLAYV